MCYFYSFHLRVDCTQELGFHVINLDGSLYLTSAEVSGLFWEDDILAAMVRQMFVMTFLTSELGEKVYVEEKKKKEDKKR